MTPLILWPIIILLFILGTAGTILPGVPGITLVFAGVLLYGAVTGFTEIGPIFVATAGAVTALALVADYAGSVLGARAGGGKWWAAGGAAAGAIVGGIVAGPLGIFAGSFIGAVLGALIEGQPGGRAFKTAGIAMLGIVGSAIVQFFLALAIVAGFIAALFI